MQGVARASDTACLQLTSQRDPIILRASPLWKPGISAILVQCWATVYYASPALSHHWVNVACLPGPSSGPTRQLVNTDAAVAVFVKIFFRASCFCRLSMMTCRFLHTLVDLSVLMRYVQATRMLLIQAQFLQDSIKGANCLFWMYLTCILDYLLYKLCF